MTAPVLAILCTGKAVGIALTVGAEVVEACTVEARRKGAALDDVQALLALGARTLTVADALIADHHAATAATWVVVRPAAPSREGHGRFSAGAAHRTGAAVATGVVAGVVLGALHGRGVTPVLVDAPHHDADETTVPECLVGRIPAAWHDAHPDRHRKGADRAPQRTAYLAGQSAPVPAPVAPVRALPTAPALYPPVRTAVPDAAVSAARAYAQSLIAAVRAAAPQTDADLLAAARHALSSTPIPDGGRSLSAVDLAVTCVLSAGIARHLYALPTDLRARLGAITTTPLRSTR